MVVWSVSRWMWKWYPVVVYRRDWSLQVGNVFPGSFRNGLAARDWSLAIDQLKVSLMIRSVFHVDLYGNKSLPSFDVLSPSR